MMDQLNKSSTKRFSVFMNVSQMEKTQGETSSFLPHLKTIHEERTYNLERDPKTVTQKLETALKSNTKSEFEARMLYDHIKDFLFFQTFNQRNKDSHFEIQAFVNICKKMKYESYPAGTVIFKEGDQPNGKMYIVYEGEIAIVIKEQDFYERQMKEEQEKKEFEMQPEYQIAKAGVEKAQKTFLTLMDNVAKSQRPSSRPKITVEDTSKSIEKSMSIERSESKILNSSEHKSSPIADSVDSPPVERHRKSKWTVIRESSKMLSNPGRLSVPRQERGSVVDKMPITVSRALNNSLNSTRKRSTSGSRERKRKKEYDDMLVHSMIKMHGTLKDTVSRGQFFGELALFDDTKRSATVITKTDCELLCIEKEDFSTIRSSFDRKKRIIQRFMTKYFPDLENNNTFSIIQGLMYLLEEKSFDLGANLAREGEIGKKFYIIYEGACEISKSIRVDQSCFMDSNIYRIKNYLRVGPVQKVDLPICKSEIGVFLSDELLFNKDSIYQFSVKTTTPKTVLFVIDRDKFLKRFPLSVLVDLEAAHKSKLSGHQIIFKHILKNRYPGTHMVYDPKISFFAQNVTIIQTQNDRARLGFAVAEQSMRTERGHESEGSPDGADTGRTSTEPNEKKLVRSNLLKQAFLHGLPDSQKEKNNAMDIIMRKASAPTIKTVTNLLDSVNQNQSKSPVKEYNQPLLSSALEYKFLSEEEMKVQKHRLDCVVKKNRVVSKKEPVPTQKHFVTPRVDQMIKRIQMVHNRNEFSLTAYKDANMLTAARVSQTEESFTIEDKDIIKHLIDEGVESHRKTTSNINRKDDKLKIKVTTKGSVYPKVDLVQKDPNERFYYTTDRSESPGNMDIAKRVDLKNYKLFNMMLKRKHRFNSRVKRTLEQESGEYISFERVAL
jgi:CRP-like cAMP-binding protein